VPWLPCVCVVFKARIMGLPRRNEGQFEILKFISVPGGCSGQRFLRQDALVCDRIWVNASRWRASSGSFGSGHRRWRAQDEARGRKTVSICRNTTVPCVTSKEWEKETTLRNMLCRLCRGCPGDVTVAALWVQNSCTYVVDRHLS